MSEENPNLERIYQIILALDRCIRSSRLYAKNNPILKKHQSELLNQFQQYFALEEKLSLVIHPFEMKVGEEVVYRNENQQESFAFRLFNDGIRTLTFQIGLTPEEIEEFVSAINQTSEVEKNAESDAVTLLWEKEFQNILYTVADTIVDEPTIDEKSTDEKIEEIIDPTMSHYAGRGEEDPEEDIYQDFKVTLNLQSMGQMFQEKVVLSPEEMKEIRAALDESDTYERLILDFVDMVLAVLQEEQDPKEYARYLHSLASVLDTNLLQGHLQIARIIMDQVTRFPTRPIAQAKLDQDVLSKTLQILWPRERLDLFIQCLNSTPQGSSEDVQTLIASFGHGAIPFLLENIERIEDPNWRKAVGQGIARLHRGDLGIFMPLISAKTPEKIEIAMIILAELKNEKVVDLVPALLQNPKLSIRKEAIQILKNHPSPKSSKMLLGLLQDSNQEVRLSALRGLSSSKDVEIARHLTGMINREDFNQKALTERKAFFYTTSKIAQDQFVPFLRDIMKRKSLFRNAELEELYQCAAVGLTAVGTPLARQVLQDAAKSGNKIVKRLSESALRLIEKNEPASKVKHA